MQWRRGAPLRSFKATASKHALRSETIEGRIQRMLPPKSGEVIKEISVKQNVISIWDELFARPLMAWFNGGNGIHVAGDWSTRVGFCSAAGKGGIGNRHRKLWSTSKILFIVTESMNW